MNGAVSFTGNFGPLKMAQYLFHLLVVLIICHKVTPAIISYEVTDQFINESNSAFFTCQAIGAPNIAITWYYNSNLLNEGNAMKYIIISSWRQLNATVITSKLKILKVKSSDVGTYVCNATDVASTDISSGILTVNVGPTIISPMEGQEFNIIEKKNLSITCTAKGYPPPNVNWKTSRGHGWFYDRIYMTGITQMQSTGVGNETSVSRTLMIIGATKEDAGIYRCVASNKVDSTILTITVLYEQVNTDFYLGFFSNGNPSIIMANSNPHWVSYFIEAPGIGFEYKGDVAPNSMRTHHIPVELETSSHTHINNGIHLRLNSSNVAVLGQNSVHKSTSDTFLSFPYSKLCVNEYVYYGISVGDGLNKSHSVVLIVGTENDTAVKLTVTQSVTINEGDGFHAIKLFPGKEYQLVIRALQTVYIGSYNDLSGTKIVTNKPVSVFSGQECARMPMNVVGCDHLIEQIPPITLWGIEHYTVPLANRSYSMKILAAYNFTNIMVYCNNTLESHWLNEGEFITKVNITENCVIDSTKEILVVQFSHRHNIDNYNGSMMTLVPTVKHYFSKFDVCTIDASNFVHYINIIVIAHCFHPEVMYLVTAEGIHESLETQRWVPIKNNNGETKMYAAQMNISEGMVKIIHTMPGALMTVVVYGFNNDKSYGHIGWNQKAFAGPFPYIAKPPSNKIIDLDTNNKNVSFSCETDRRLYITWERRNGSIGNGSIGNGSIALERANGINSNILTLINLQPEDAGEYRCVVDNPFYGNCPSDYATMTIKVSDPKIVIQPNVAYAAAPFSAAFTCSAKGYGKLNITWLKSSGNLPNKTTNVIITDLPDITNSILIIPNANNEDGGVYICMVQHINGFELKSAILHISDAPIPPEVLTTSVMPINLTINNYNLSLECRGMPKDGFNYRWGKGNLEIQGEYSSNLTIYNLKPEHSGYYRCIVSNSTGVIESPRKRVIVKVGLPIIVKQPVSTRVNVTDDVIFDCTASAYGDIKITWKKLNSTLPNTALPLEEIKSVNKKTSILKISNAIGYYKGYYYATISNGGGEINTSTVYLDVIIPCPEMINPPIPTIVKFGETAIFRCLAYSYGKLVYQWKRDKNSTLPSNADAYFSTTESWLNISNAQVSNEGKYCCVATNECGGTARCAWLEVKTSIKFIVQPNVSVEYKQNKTRVYPFECLATGIGKIHYQWEKYNPINNSWIKPSNRVVDVTSRHLVFSVIKEEDEGIYRCVAANDDDMVASSSSNIVVYGPVVINYITENTIAFEGENLNLICNVTNDINSSIVITWYHESEPIVDKHHENLMISNHTNNVAGHLQSVLSFNPVYHTDKGQYKCRALNHLECVAEANTSLTVEYAPTVLIDGKMQPSDEILYVGETKQLVCTAEGFPTPMVQWYKDNQPVEDFASSFKVLDIPTKMPQITMYTCVATNYAGNKQCTRETKITVEVKKRCPKLANTENGEIVYVNEEIIVFTCNDSTIKFLKCIDGEWNGDPPICIKEIL